MRASESYAKAKSFSRHSHYYFLTSEDYRKFPAKETNPSRKADKSSFLKAGYKI